MEVHNLCIGGETMNIIDVRYMTRMSQKKFSEYFGIPVGTLRNWEQGIAKPPEYVIEMIFNIIRRDKMINVETIKFIKILDELAEHSKNGIESFEFANECTYRTKVFYDESTLGEDGYKVVYGAVVIDNEDNYHHDIIGYYDSDNFEYTIRVKIDEAPYIEVKFMMNDDQIIIENGMWYFV